jgi:hypothetical protein
MPESTNTTLMELAGRYQAGGEEAIAQRYPDDIHFLAIPPVGAEQPPLLWTSQTSILQGTTEIPLEDRKKLLSVYADPSTVITPLKKKNRNAQEDIILGRGNDCDVRFKSKETSKVHAKLKIRGNKLFLKDLSSTNGTFINQCKMLPDSLYQISPSQEIRFGTTRTAYIDLEHLLELVKLAT